MADDRWGDCPVCHLHSDPDFLPEKQERDLITELKQPYEPWEARERECKKMDEAK